MKYSCDGAVNACASLQIVSIVFSASVRFSARIVSILAISALISCLDIKSFPFTFSTPSLRSPVPLQKAINSALFVVEKWRSRTVSTRDRLISSLFRCGG